MRKAIHSPPISRIMNNTRVIHVIFYNYISGCQLKTTQSAIERGFDTFIGCASYRA
ncbi:hypothetical protein J7M23_03840 [Candidatus Sumerlaeota bacterium]|nr:hypothetical protein [Candidatus Sumerlaeota bacterium]